MAKQRYSGKPQVCKRTYSPAVDRLYQAPNRCNKKSGTIPQRRGGSSSGTPIRRHVFSTYTVFIAAILLFRIPDVKRRCGTPDPGKSPEQRHVDIAVIGGSLAGCAATRLLAHEGFKVALVEHHEDLEALTQLCMHFIQATFSNDSSSLPRRRSLRRRGICTRTEPG